MPATLHNKSGPNPDRPSHRHSWGALRRFRASAVARWSFVLGAARSMWTLTPAEHVNEWGYASDDFVSVVLTRIGSA